MKIKLFYHYMYYYFMANNIHVCCTYVYMYMYMYYVPLVMELVRNNNNMNKKRKTKQSTHTHCEMINIPMKVLCCVFKSTMWADCLLHVHVCCRCCPYMYMCTCMAKQIIYSLELLSVSSIPPN